MSQVLQMLQMGEREHFKVRALDTKDYAALIDQLKEQGWEWYKDFFFELEGGIIHVYVYKDDAQSLKELLVEYLI